jgi:hypothetical protein
MSALVHEPAAILVRRSSRERVSASPLATLRLLPSGEGWSLVGPAGELVFDAPGVRGRRRCLEFARAHGVVAVLS